MKMRTRILCFLGIVLVSLLTDTTIVRAGEILLIAHSSVSADSLDRATISDIYLGKKAKWDNGDKIRVVMLKKGSTHETFARDIVGTTPAKLKNFWKKVVFTGAGTPPKILKKEADLIEFVADTEGAIGYIDSSTPYENVKVISIEE